MAISSGAASSQGRFEKRVGAQQSGAEGTACEVMLAGPEAMALRGTVEKLLPAGAGIKEAESILEAVLMFGGGGRSGEVPVILVGISQEIEQIEPAIRSMRKNYPGSRIVLLCEPGDEVLCRKAKGWGATDYVILPADVGSLRKVLAAPAGGKAGAERVPSVNGETRGSTERVAAAALVKKVVEVPAEAGLGRRKAEASDVAAPEERPQAVRGGGPGFESGIPGLPLMVQTVLLNDLLVGRADYAARVVATLQTYMKWGGALKFIAAETEAAGPTAENPLQMRTVVGMPQQAPFGTLVLERSAEGAAGPSMAALAQAGQWLASLLSISRRYEQLRSLAITDELSGAYNRRYFTKFMSGLLERARENRFRVTLLLFDIDDFKKYNDQFGHAAGDAIIRELIKLLRSCSRPHDLVARLGGDEFAVVYWDNEAPRQPNSEHPRDALAATERFRKAVKAHEWSAACNVKGELSISGGLATFPWDADSLETLTARADEALLRAKAAGKNVILLHEGEGGGAEGVEA